MLSTESNASFSSCGTYRWSLYRRINKSKKTIIFVGLNPSFANAIRNDKTLARVINFVDSWGYGSLIVVNLFAKISKVPISLKLCSDPIGERNHMELERTFLNWSSDQFCDLWLGWGVHGKYMNRNSEVLSMIDEFKRKRCNRFSDSSMALVLGKTKEGHPRHPLYVCKKEVLKPFKLTSR